MNIEQLSQDRNMELEKQFHSEIEPWILERAQKSRHIDILEYDPETYSEHRIDVGLTPHSEIFGSQENKESIQTLLGMLSMSMGSEQSAAVFVNQFNSIGINGVPKIERIKSYLAEGLNVGIITPHATYDDIAKAVSAATIAMGDKSQIANNMLIINKAFSRLKFYEMPLSVPCRMVGKIAWFMPEIGAKKHNISTEVFSGINRRGIKAYNTELRKGGQMVGYAPTGTGVSIDEDGQMLFIQPPESSIGILSKLDVIVPVTVWKNESDETYFTEVGDMLEINHMSERQDRQLLGKHIGEILCGQLADVSGLPVKKIG